MNAARLPWNVLRLADPLRSPRCIVNPALLSTFAHRRPTNEEIKHKYVQVVNEEGKLNSPTGLDSVLASIDRKEFYVELVNDDQPIVKILNKKAEFDKAKARTKAKKAAARAPEQKEIQMTWGVAAGDLEHKLNKVRKELEKKNRVDLIFAPKKKQPMPNPDERAAKVDEVFEELKDVGREWKPRTLQKALMTLHLQGLGPKAIDSNS
jgi:translation initiation factor IF-3